MIRMISITNELHELLKEEDNASALISRLLNSHYSSINAKELEVVETNVFDTMNKSTKIINKELANQSLRDVVLSELTDEEKAKLIFNENNENN